MAFPGIFYRVRAQSAALSLPHVASRCARGSAYRGLSSACWRATEDGHLRHAALQPGLVSGAVPGERMVGHDTCADWHYLWRASGSGAAQPEEADRILID